MGGPPGYFDSASKEKLGSFDRRGVIKEKIDYCLGHPPAYGPTRVVTLEAGSVAEKEFPLTGMLACAAKLYVPDVTQGVIVFAVKPFST